MGKKVREYKSGDFIFAKVKGYPAWPARVQKLNGKKYFVYFYGTGETANLPPNMIFDYAENKDKFLTKTVKRRDFNDGVKQIEHDFANNVPLEDVIGVLAEAPADTTANDTANETVNDTMDDTAADTTAADDTVADESAAQNDGGVEDSDETGALVIDEGNKEKKGRKSKVETKPTKETPVKPVKEPKTPRGKPKKDESKEEEKEEEKKEEEIISRSGRKIRPKRYIDEQTEENTTLPSPAPKKRRGASPIVEKDKEKERAESVKEKSLEKNLKQYHTVSQSELEDLKEPFKQDDAEKENILIAYLPTGQYVGIKLFQSRPASFKNESTRLQWDKQAASNAVTLKLQLERGQIKSESVLAQLVTELNLSEEEKATLDKERETDEKKSRVQFLKTEMKLIELDAKIKTCLCLEKADTELCLKSLDELMELDVKPLMLLKHPTCLETVKRMRAYVGNTPSWDLSESAALVFSKQAHQIRKQADTLYKNMKELFVTPEGLSFWEFFSERVLHFKKVTSKLSPDELLEMVHEPLEMSLPTAHTMKAAIDAANEEQKDGEESNDKKKNTPVKPKKTANNNTPSKAATKRQSFRKVQQEEKETEQKNSKKESNDKKDTVEEEDKQPDNVNNTEKDTQNSEQNNKETESTEVEKETTEEDKSPKEKTPEDKSSKEKSPKEKNVEEKSTKEKSVKEKSPDDKSTKEKSQKEKSPSPAGKDKESDKGKDDKAKEDKTESKEEKDKDAGEPRAKRSRESKKTEPPPPRSPAKRKSKV
ncbi:uncharacterized protein ACR2FA_010729 [Aphomia sociella]